MLIDCFTRKSPPTRHHAIADANTIAHNDSDDNKRSRPPAAYAGADNAVTDAADVSNATTNDGIADIADAISDDAITDIPNTISDDTLGSSVTNCDHTRVK